MQHLYNAKMLKLKPYVCYVYFKLILRQAFKLEKNEKLCRDFVDIFEKIMNIFKEFIYYRQKILIILIATSKLYDVLASTKVYHY